MNFYIGHEINVHFLSYPEEGKIKIFWEKKSVKNGLCLRYLLQSTIDISSSGRMYVHILLSPLPTKILDVYFS